MKRDKRLYPLSRRHHDLLVYADQVKMALTTGHPAYRLSTEELSEKTLTFWNAIFFEHMIAEREILFPGLIKYPEEFQKEINVLNEEFEELAELYSAISNLSAADKGLKDKLIRFAGLIVHHVRFEERSLFPKLQSYLLQAELDQIGHALEKKLARVCRSPVK